MPNLEYSESIPKCGCGKIHNCKICPYVTKSLFYVVSDLKRHGLPLESSRCERNDLEKYFCKDCNFETDLLKKNVRTYVQCLVVMNSGTDASVVPLRQRRQQFWKDTRPNMKQHNAIRHSADAIQWYNCDKCEFKTKWNENLTRHKAIHVSADAIQWYNCDKCEFKTKYKGNIKQHNAIHHSADAIHCCDKCEFKTKWKESLKKHTKSHLGMVKCY
ncbi:hypothetical protein MTP99_002652 [Tenebrio molitor]|nr:hypothetical protein MTP99_002652 [Tenebrio molitor]